jgi:hypothetical protein
VNWEQKFAAIIALGEATLYMRKPGDWYVAQRSVEVKQLERDGMLQHRYGNGATPEEAVEAHFRRLTDEKPLAYIVTRHAGVRRRVLWNGFMWVDLGPDREAAS